ncbi:NUDIX hydrolase [Roseovarius sp. 2305UL8-3]|uniref:NUDIX hydrolase n=1 Tax=Roseovarius conchicola TaxID=3121636 RepID=UPI0035286674
MNLHSVKQKPISLLNNDKRDVRTQFSALCYRMVRGRPEILLITSRRSGRWILPKGWPMDGKTPSESAMIEAWEEAGVIGKVSPKCLGLYSYHKEISPEEDLPCVAMVYPIRVKSLASKYPEAGERKRKWLRPKQAAERVAEPELAHILRKFDPDLI